MPIRPITRRSSDSQIFLPRPAHPHSSPTNPTSSSLCTAHQPISVALSVAVGVEPRGGRDHVGRPRRKWRAVATRACLVSPRRGPRRSTLPQRFLCVCSRGQERERVEYIEEIGSSRYIHTYVVIFICAFLELGWGRGACGEWGEVCVVDFQECLG